MIIPNVSISFIYTNTHSDKLVTHQSSYLFYIELFYVYFTIYLFVFYVLHKLFSFARLTTLYSIQNYNTFYRRTFLYSFVIDVLRFFTKKGPVEKIDAMFIVELYRNLLENI